MPGVPWTSFESIIDLGLPSSTALTSMSLGLSIVIEYIYHTEEQSEHNNIRLTMSANSFNQSILNDKGQEPVALWKKICLFSLVILISLFVGVSRFIIGSHSLDQVIFGWMLGAWIAFTYFGLVREHVHEHV